MLTPMRTSTTFLAMFILALFALPLEGASAEVLPRAVLIIDGSGSMWGRINNREKIVIVRDRLADRIELLKGKADLGVMSYGHRRRRDCRDIEMIVPIAPVETTIHAKAIKRLLPRGKTPITSALQMAAKALVIPGSGTQKKQKSHIILVADGNENCRLDPCQTATILKAKHPGLTIHVIGFAVPDKDVAQLQCISNNTSGRFLKADNAVQLEQAIDRIFASLGPEKKSPVISRKEKPAIPPGLYLSAGLAKQGSALEKNVSWRIYRHGESAKTSATPLHRKADAHPFLPLPEGKYHIEARHHTLIAAQNIELRRGQALKLRFSFNVGIVTASARLGKDASPSSDIIFSLYDASSGPVGPGNIIAHKQEENAVFYLAPGKYTLKARASETHVLQDFTLKAGELKHHNLLLDAGQINLKAHLSNDKPALDDVQYTIYKRGAKKDVEFVRTLDPTPKLILPAGEYFVLARKGSASTYARIQVVAGEIKTLPLILDAGILQLSSPQDNRAHDQTAHIAYTIEPTKPANPQTIKLSPDGKLGEFDQTFPARSFRSSFVLPAGTYLIRALYGNSNAQAATRVEVKAGQASQYEISMSAGRVELLLALSADDPPLPGVFWSILDQSGKQIASASSMTPRLTLANGSYQVVADYLGQSTRRNFIIENGDDKKIRLLVQ